MTDSSPPTGDGSPPAESLIHIADLHFWKVVYNPLRLLNKRFIGNTNVWLKRRKQFLTERAESYAAYIAQCGPSQALLTGDFASTSVDEEFEMGARFVAALQAKGIKSIAMPGNHDVYTFESVRKRRFEKHFGDWLPENGFPARLGLENGTPLVVVPTACPNLLSSRGNITQAEIEQALALVQDVNGLLIVSGHYPLLERTHAYRTTANRQLRNAHVLRRALGESGRRTLYVAGHVHRFSYVRDPDHPNLSHLTTGALFYRNHHTDIEGEFSEIHVREGHFQVLRHTFNQRWGVTEEIERRDQTTA